VLFGKTVKLKKRNSKASPKALGYTQKNSS